MKLSASSNSISFLSSKKVKASPPAPSNYTILSPRPTGGKFGTSKRADLWSPPISPGPVRYSNLNILSTNRSPSYSITGKKPQSQTKNPGPGAYSPRLIESKAQNATIGKSKRLNLTMCPNTPGPGRYDLNCTAEAPSWTFKGSRDNSFCTKGPGPGQYEAVDLNKSTGGLILSSKRQDLFTPNQGPGPAAYDSHNSSMLKSGFSIGKSKREEKAKPTPGPGLYEFKILSHSFSARFGKEAKKTLQVLNDNPGSNAYSPGLAKVSPAFTFGIKYKQIKDSPAPGPADYSPKKTGDNANVKIGKAPRFIKAKLGEGKSAEV